MAYNKNYVRVGCYFDIHFKFHDTPILQIRRLWLRVTLSLIHEWLAEPGLKPRSDCALCTHSPHSALEVLR